MNKINFEITVDVSDIDIHDKRLVIEAFNKLGLEFKYVDNENYIEYLDKHSKAFTNKYECGKISEYLLFSSESITSTHTIDELFRLVDSKRERNYILSDDEIKEVITKAGIEPEFSYRHVALAVQEAIMEKIGEPVAYIRKLPKNVDVSQSLTLYFAKDLGNLNDFIEGIEFTPLYKIRK